MPDENGTETTRPDAPSADESLFGDKADDRAAPVVQAEDSNDAAPDEPEGAETEQEGQTPDDSGEQAAGDEADPSEDLKVVLSIKGGRATIGVQRLSADPHIESFDDLDESGLMLEVSAVIERARARWEDDPKHPTYVRPAPPARRRNRRQQGSAQVATAETQEAERQQQTLRLF